MNNFYVVIKRDFYYDSTEIFCEDGIFHTLQKLMQQKQRPVLFNSYWSARQAKKIIGGHWPFYAVIKVEDPSWLD